MAGLFSFCVRFGVELLGHMLCENVKTRCVVRLGLTEMLTLKTFLSGRRAFFLVAIPRLRHSAIL